MYWNVFLRIFLILFVNFFSTTPCLANNAGPSKAAPVTVLYRTRVIYTWLKLVSLVNIFKWNGKLTSLECSLNYVYQLKYLTNHFCRTWWIQLDATFFTCFPFCLFVTNVSFFFFLFSILFKCLSISIGIFLYTCTRFFVFCFTRDDHEFISEILNFMFLNINSNIIIPN